MSTYIELEIQNLLNQGEAPSSIGERLVADLESSEEKFTNENIEALSGFLLRSGMYESLIQLVLRHFDKESFHIPWPYFVEALALSGPDLDSKTVKALLEGIEEQKAHEEIIHTQALDKYAPKINEWRSDHKYQVHRDYLANKKLLLEQLITLRTQQLYQQEKNLLLRLQKMYPGDRDVRREVQEHKQRYALEILARRSPSRHHNAEEAPKPDPEVEAALQALNESLLESVQNNPDMAMDFAIAAFILESYETALELLSYADETASLLWFRLEILLKCRRFLDVLNEVARVELIFTNDPETFFATAYLRAQALWGLGQRHTAMEVMESLLLSRPHYRAGSALMSLWSSL